MGTARQLLPKMDAQTSIASYDQLQALLMYDERFSSFEVVKDGAEQTTLIAEDGSVSLIFLGKGIWSETALLRPFIERSQSHAVSVLCISSAENVAETPNSFATEYVQPLPLPLNVAQVRQMVFSAVALRQQIQKLAAKAETISTEDDEIKHILQISRELNGIRDVDRLLELILKRAREITSADAGSIYVVSCPSDNIMEGEITFKITQNDSIQPAFASFQLKVDNNSMVGAAVIARQTINIPDNYKLSDDRSQNPHGVAYNKQWDLKNGYECHSMMTVPMFDISHNVVGVIQLINCKNAQKQKLTQKDDFAKFVIPFDAAAVEYAEIVAKQAGIALENAMLTDEKKALFEGFVSASVKAIEQRDPTTSGHSHRVAQLTLQLARNVHVLQEGPLKSVTFNDDQFKEIEYASLLHDFGKLGVREQVLVKAKKLYPWETQSLEERFEVIRSRIEIEYLRELVRFFQHPEQFPPGFNESSIQMEWQAKQRELEQHWQVIMKANEPTILEQGGFEMLTDIASKNFIDSSGKRRPYLLSNELKALSVSKGSLTQEEFAEIQSHVDHTFEFLRTIPWGKKFANVPTIAAKHHEKLDGSGYPKNSVATEIPLQSRMMAISDIFDALTASDRPYKKAVPAIRALEIIEIDVKANKCDPELFKIFVESGCYKIVF